jgi:predicted RNA-binding Zn-ribbon protein involved in translation (DUF1610 family)
VHPALNAEPASAHHILYAFGYDSAAPRTADLSIVIQRLGRIIDGFADKNLQQRVTSLVDLRNREIHTAGLVFSEVGEAQWAPPFYEVADKVSKFMKRDLTDLLGDEAEYARKLLNDKRDQVRESVAKTVAAHAKVFSGKPNDEQSALIAQANAAIQRLGAPHFPCPACGAKARLIGAFIRESATTFEDGYLTYTATSSSDELSCFACGLRLQSLAETTAAGAPPTFSRLMSKDLPEPVEDPYMDM